MKNTQEISLNKFKKIVWQTFCEADEKYLDLTRIGYVLVLLGALVFQIYAIFKGNSFTMTDFGTGISIILFGGGAGIGIRAKLEDNKKRGEQ